MFLAVEEEEQEEYDDIVIVCEWKLTKWRED